MSDIDWSRGTYTASTNSGRYYHPESFRDEMEMRYQRIRPDPILREMREINLELKDLKAEKIILKKPVTEEKPKEPIFFDPKELDI